MFDPISTWKYQRSCGTADTRIIWKGQQGRCLQFCNWRLRWGDSPLRGWGIAWPVLGLVGRLKNRVITTFYCCSKVEKYWSWKGAPPSSFLSNSSFPPVLFIGGTWHEDSRKHTGNAAYRVQAPVPQNREEKGEIHLKMLPYLFISSLSLLRNKAAIIVRTICVLLLNHFSFLSNVEQATIQNFIFPCKLFIIYFYCIFIYILL